MDIKFAATSRPGPRDELVEWVQAAESLGFHRIGVADSPALYRDLWVSLTHVALNTRRLPFGPWVTNPVTRHPVVTASAASALEELAPGRICIGVGSGNSGVYNAGRRAASLASLREYVTTLRSLMTTGEAEYREVRPGCDGPTRGEKFPSIWQPTPAAPCGWSASSPTAWSSAQAQPRKWLRRHSKPWQTAPASPVETPRTSTSGGPFPSTSATATTRGWTPREVRHERPTISTASP